MRVEEKAEEEAEEEKRVKEKEEGERGRGKWRRGVFQGPAVNHQTGYDSRLLSYKLISID